jgi:hypothetical protein
MKKFKVRTFYSGSAMEVVVCAVKTIDARRHVQTFFKGCRVLTVTEINEDASLAVKQIPQMAA